MAKLDALIEVKEKPWTNLGTQFQSQPKSSDEIIHKALMNWAVGAAPMTTDIHGHVSGYHAIFREDNNEILGVVNKKYPEIVQNSETFKIIEPLLGKDLSIESAGSLSGGNFVFGCFKLNDKYTLLDDECEHYIVVMNDHCKPDGMVTVIQTPVRITCQNILNYAMAKAVHTARIPITFDTHQNQIFADKVINSFKNSQHYMNVISKKMFDTKMTESNRVKLLDELFPFIDSDGESIHSSANEATEMIRNTFVDKCLNAEDLSNYENTQWQFLNALVDFDTHYYKNLDKTYDLQYRMTKIPGVGTPSEPSIVAKYIKIKDKFIAA